VNAAEKKTKKRRSAKQPDAPMDRSKYTEKPVAAIAAEEKVNSRPPKDSVAPATQYSFDDFPPLNNDGFPPISGQNNEEHPPPAPEPGPDELPSSPIEMSILPAEGGEEKGDKIGHSKRRSSFTRHRSRERASGSEKEEEKKDKNEKSKEKSDKVGSQSSSKRRSKPKLRGSDERTSKQ